MTPLGGGGGGGGGGEHVPQGDVVTTTSSIQTSPVTWPTSYWKAAFPSVVLWV
jgi:hypothetical protein